MVHHKYFYFKEALNPEQCQSIIETGLSQIKQDKKRGVSVAGTTAGDNHKQAQDDTALPQADKDLQQLKSENVKKTYVRDSEVTC